INAIYTNKLELSLLGVKNYTQDLNIKHFEKKLIISCSTVSEGKGVLKTLNILKNVSYPIHWIHFGDGPEYDKLTTQITNLPNHISVDLKGHIQNKEVISFYQKNKVDLFLSLSTSEGIPVSM